MHVYNEKEHIRFIEIKKMYSLKIKENTKRFNVGVKDSTKRDKKRPDPNKGRVPSWQDSI